MRVELPRGQWAEIREHITHGADKRIRAGLRAAKGTVDDSDENLALNTLVIAEFVKAWDVKDPDGNPIEVGSPDWVDRAPDDVADALITAASAMWKGSDPPNPPTPP